MLADNGGVYDHLDHEFNDDFGDELAEIAAPDVRDEDSRGDVDTSAPDPWEEDPTGMLLNLIADALQLAAVRPGALDQTYKELVEELVDYQDEPRVDFEKIYTKHPELRPLVAAALTLSSDL